MTNLLIGYNNLIELSKTLECSRESLGIQDVDALISNRKFHYSESAAAHANISFTIDLGVGVTKTADFLAFPSWFISGQSIALQGSSNNFSSSTTITTVTSTEITNNRLGFYAQDYLETFPTSTAFRYWRILATADSGTISGYYSKFFFGTILDLGCDPDSYSIKGDIEESRLITDGGYSYNQKFRNEKREISFEWVGVTDAKILEFEGMFRIHDEPLIYLYTTNSEYLHGVSLISGNIISHKVEKVAANYNRLSVIVQEAI
jgi:hypothetical protein